MLFGLSGSGSLMSEEIMRSGLSFMVHSQLAKIVANCTKLILSRCIIALAAFLNEPTILSTAEFKWGARGALNFHATCSGF
jgi:hypothetical protein